MITMDNRESKKDPFGRFEWVQGLVQLMLFYSMLRRNAINLYPFLSP